MLTLVLGFSLVIVFLYDGIVIDKRTWGTWPAREYLVITYNVNVNI